MPTAMVIAGLIVAGAVIFTGFYLKGSTPADLKETLEEGAGPAAIEGTEPAGEETSQEGTSQYATATLESFVTCLEDKGMKFYGAHWCGWCNKQKEEIGQLGQELLYVECVDQETGEMTQPCQETGITSFPTWILADGTKNPGYKPLEDLAKLSGCSLGD